MLFKSRSRGIRCAAKRHTHSRQAAAQKAMILRRAAICQLDGPAPTVGTEKPPSPARPARLPAPGQRWVQNKHRVHQFYVGLPSIVALPWAFVVPPLTTSATVCLQRGSSLAGEQSFEALGVAAGSSTAGARWAVRRNTVLAQGAQMEHGVSQPICRREKEEWPCIWLFEQQAAGQAGSRQLCTDRPACECACTLSGSPDRLAANNCSTAVVAIHIALGRPAAPRSPFQRPGTCAHLPQASYHTASYHAASYHTASYHTASCHMTPMWACPAYLSGSGWLHDRPATPVPLPAR